MRTSNTPTWHFVGVISLWQAVKRWNPITHYENNFFTDYLLTDISQIFAIADMPIELTSHDSEPLAANLWGLFQITEK